MTTVITETLLDALRQRVADLMSYGRYMVGGSWIRSEIVTKEVQQSGIVYVCFYVNKSAAPATKFQLLDSSDNVLAEREETLTVPDSYDAVLYRFKFGVSAGEFTAEDDNE